MTSRQSGYVLVSAMLALTLVSAVMVFVLGQRLEAQIRDEAVARGRYLAHYNSGVRAFISDLGAQSIVSSGCAGAPCIIAGTLWLKDSDDCPDANAAGVVSVEPYLECSFPDSFAGIQPRTAIFDTGAAIHAVTYMGTFTGSQEEVRMDLAQLSALSAISEQPSVGMSTVTGAGTPIGTPLAGTAFFQYYVYEDGLSVWGYAAGQAAPPADGELVAEANTAPSLDSWLRTDGSNAMQADLNMNGNDIVGAGTVNMVDGVVESVGARLSDAIYFGGLFRHGAFLQKPTCDRDPANNPGGEGIPQAFVTTSGVVYQTDATLGGEALHGFLSYAVDCTGNSLAGNDNDQNICGTTPGPAQQYWQIKAFALTAGGLPQPLEDPVGTPDHIGAFPTFTRCYWP